MGREFFAVVYGEGMADVLGHFFEGLLGGFVKRRGAFVVHEAGGGVEGLVFDEGGDGTFVVAPNHGVAFPVAHPLLAVDDGGAFFDGKAVGDCSSVAFADAVWPFFLCPWRSPL